MVTRLTYVENHEDTNELGEAEGNTKFERCESRNHSSATLPGGEIKSVSVWTQCDGEPDDIGNAGDVDVPGGEWGGHRGFCH